MNLKAALLIFSLLLATVIYSDSFESDESVDCDSLFVEAEDNLLLKFLQRQNLLNEYDSRNDNYETCLLFLGRFFSLIDEYRKEEGKQDDYIVMKRANRMRPKGFGKMKSILKKKYYK